MINFFARNKTLSSIDKTSHLVIGTLKFQTQTHANNIQTLRVTDQTTADAVVVNFAPDGCVIDANCVRPGTRISHINYNPVTGLPAFSQQRHLDLKTMDRLEIRYDDMTGQPLHTIPPEIAEQYFQLVDKDIVLPKFYEMLNSFTDTQASPASQFLQFKMLSLLKDYQARPCFTQATLKP